MLQGHDTSRTEAINRLYSLNKAVLDTPNDPAVWTARGDLHFSKDLGERGKPARGMADYDRAISINPKFIEAWRGKGYALFAQRKYEAAAEALTVAIDNGGHCSGLFIRRGLCFKRLNEINKARTDFRHILTNCVCGEDVRNFVSLMVTGLPESTAVPPKRREHRQAIVGEGVKDDGYDRQ